MTAAICRPDRAIFAATSYVANALGRKFVEPPVLDLGETLGDSTPLSPLIFVLSAGVDPTQILRKLALERSMGSKFFTVALGQGQVGPLASHICTSPVLTHHQPACLTQACQSNTWEGENAGATRTSEVIGR